MSATASNASRIGLDPQEMRALTRRSDWRGCWMVASTWLSILGIFMVMAFAPHPAVILLGAILLAGRQMALAVLQHEAAHGTLCRSRAINDLIGDWLCARPIWLSLRRYREHHMAHHRFTGTDADTDASLNRPFPTTRASLARKMLRDVSGVTGLKLMLGWVLMYSGVVRWTVATDIERLPQDGRRWFDYPIAFVRNAWPTLLFNAAMATALVLAGHGWLFAFWVGAYLTPFPLFLRIRSIAEHACTPASDDPFVNTRTTRAGWLARLTVAPMHVNYHLEHHLLASVPAWKLPELHRQLRDKGLTGPAPGYRDVLRLAASGPPAAA